MDDFGYGKGQITGGRQVVLVKQQGYKFASCDGSKIGCPNRLVIASYYHRKACDCFDSDIEQTKQSGSRNPQRPQCWFDLECQNSALFPLKNDCCHRKVPIAICRALAGYVVLTSSATGESIEAATSAARRGMRVPSRVENMSHSVGDSTARSSARDYATWLSRSIVLGTWHKRH